MTPVTPSSVCDMQGESLLENVALYGQAISLGDLDHATNIYAAIRAALAERTQQEALTDEPDAYLFAVRHPQPRPRYEEFAALDWYPGIDDNRVLISKKPLYLTRPTSAANSTAPMQPSDDMVNRFLSWPLPKGFSPDCGISFDGRKDDEWNKNKTWPIGTNLLCADQAREMLAYVLAAQPAAAPTQAAGGEAMPALTKQLMNDLVRSVQPSLHEESRAWRDLRKEATYWYKAIQALIAAAPASQAAGGEVVLYQWRTRAGWLVPNAWSQWECCTPDVAADYERTPLLHDWHYEVRRLCLTAAPAAAVEPIIKYVPINTKEYREHPNDKEVSSPECEQALDDRGDSEGQGLDPFWKWAFRQGWAARGAGGKAMPAGYFLRDEQTGYLRQVQGYMSDYPGVIALYAAAPAAAVEPRTTPLCRDCADFGPICPSSGQPCDKRAAAAPEGLTDMRAICEALGFDPTNHHNAAKCPYCRPATPDTNHQEDTP